jgi:hypothetical protein
MLTIRPLTKKLRREICQQIIDRCPIGEELPADDLKAFNEMLGTDFPAAKHMRNAEYPDPRHVHVLDGDRWRAFSWNKAISPRTDWTELCNTMRKLAKEQADAYKSETSETECAYAHKGGCNGPLQADHAGMPFDDIAKAFVDEFGTPELDEGPPGAGKIFKDIDMEANWIGFHAQRVVWQLLCRTHNASKGKKRLQ